MKNAISRDTSQIEITNFCPQGCSNCTRFCTHHKEPFFLSWEQFKEAVDSMEGFPKMVGAMGGEPLYHKEFDRFSLYLASKFPKEQLGLWSAFPKGKEHYREVICKVYGNIFLNDHSRADIFHAPILIAIDEVVKDKNIMWAAIDNCWLQEAWSPTINPYGAYFCEQAGALAILFQDSETAWKVEPGWWWRNPWDFKDQIKKWCPKCGMAAPLPRRRSIDKIDDISQGNYERLKDISLKLQKGLYKISDLQTLPRKELDKRYPMAAYKDTKWRNQIANRYGMFLTINDQGFWTPHLIKDFDAERANESLFERYKKRYEECHHLTV